MIKSKLINKFFMISIITIITIIIASLFYLVFNNSNSNSNSYLPVSTRAPALSVEVEMVNSPTASAKPEVQPEQTDTYPPNELGYVFQNTINGVDSPKYFIPRFFLTGSISGSGNTEKTADEAVYNTGGLRLQVKWFYDKTNPHSIERTILNTNKTYSDAELSALGKTNKPNTYLVNKIITKYDKNHIYFYKTTGLFQPMIYTTYENYEKYYKKHKS